MDGPIANLASWLEQVRKHHRLSQDEFAGMIGMGTRNYQELVGGNRSRINPQTRKGILAGLGLTSQELADIEAGADVDVPERVGARGGALEDRITRLEAQLEVVLSMLRDRQR